jgi:hypothetical protein
VGWPHPHPPHHPHPHTPLWVGSSPAEVGKDGATPTVSSVGVEAPFAGVEGGGGVPLHPLFFFFFFLFFFFICNVYSFKAQRDATLVHRNYTIELINHRKITILNTQKNRNMQTIPCLSIYTGIVASSSSFLAIHAHNL